MDGQKLVKMANQIASFFAAEPDRKVAVEGVAGHLKRFWEPRMRREILAMVDRGDVASMHELVLEALKGHRAVLAPSS
ncbi:MAG: formate dehydrogenase subunit delta [Planctomycetota bacterium]